jgi:hypothetical protein
LFDRVCKQVGSVQRAQRVPESETQGDGEVVTNPLPPSTTEICGAENVTIPERMFVRAVASTVDGTRPPVDEASNNLQRFAYTNPVWIRDIPDSTGGADEMAPPEVAASCSKSSTAVCTAKRADCGVVHSASGAAIDVCLWSAVTTPSACTGTGGIWTTATSRFARNHPDALRVGSGGACMTQPGNFNCQAASARQCKSRGATCDVVHASNGAASEVCRWSGESSANACSSTAGIWTPAGSNYARRHPNAIAPGADGACITEVDNLRRIID